MGALNSGSEEQRLVCLADVWSWWALTCSPHPVNCPGHHSADPKHERKVTLMLKRVDKYFSDNNEQKESTEKDPQLEDAVDTEKEEEKLEVSSEDDSSPMEKRRSISFIPLASPDLWNAEKADPKDIQALGTALLKMKDLKESAVDLGSVTNPYSIFHVKISIHQSDHTINLTCFFLISSWFQCFSSFPCPYWPSNWSNHSCL